MEQMDSYSMKEIIEAITKPSCTRTEPRDGFFVFKNIIMSLDVYLYKDRSISNSLTHQMDGVCMKMEYRELVEAVELKMAKNKNRTWSNADSNGVINHIKS